MAFHLCIDVRMLNASGIGTFLRNIIPHLLGRVQLTLLYLERDEEEVLAFSGCALIGMKSEIYTIREQFELPRKIPKCDLFWSPHYNIPLFPIRAKKRLVKIHDVAPLVLFSSLSLLQKIYARLFFNAALLLSDHVTAVSAFTQGEIEKYCFVKKKVTPIHHSLASYFSRSVSEEERESVRARYHLPQNFLLWVGNVKPHKNLVRLLEAYRLLKPDYDLVLLGNKEKMRSIDLKVLALVEEDPFLRKRVHFTGYLPNEAIPALYALARLFLFPSLYEGFGLPPLEALAMGCPSVVAKCASLPEVYEDAVEYVDPTSVSSIAAGIDRLLKDEKRCAELLSKGEKLLERYTPQRCAERYLALMGVE